MKKEYPLSGIKKIKLLKKDCCLILTDNASRIYTSPFLENQEEFNAELEGILQPEKSGSEKIIYALSWFFCIGFVVSRFVPNVWIYAFFSAGFIVISIIAIYQRLHMNVRPWIKIYMVIFYLIFDALILYSMIELFRRMAA